MSLFQISSFVTSVVLSAATNGGPYPWVDPQGGAQRDRAPPAIAGKEAIAPAISASGEGERQLALNDAMQGVQQTANEDANAVQEPRLKREGEASKQAKCDGARSQREELERPVMIELQSDGHMHALTKEERRSRIAEADQRIAGLCPHVP
jgi:hypothetical protein